MNCGKITYNSRTEATLAVKGSNRDRRVSKGNHKIKETYYCDVCVGWHTSSGGKKRKYKKPVNQIELNGGEKIRRYNRMKRDRFIHIKDFNKRK